ncbi:MAG: aspartate 1-decarboxylase [Pseudomonadota bacterium]
MCLNGAAARMAHTGDIVIIAAFGQVTQEDLKAYTPVRVMVDAKNHVSAIETT